MSCKAPHYSEQAFWEDRFAEGIYGETYEWVADFDVLAPVLLGLFTDVPGGTSSCHVLHLGCGNSELPEQLYDGLGVQHCTNVDFSREVIAQMERRNAQIRPEMSWLVADCTDMRGILPESGCFHVVMEKGLVDAIACTAERRHRCRKLYQLLSEVARLLMAGGFFILASVDPQTPQKLAEACSFEEDRETAGRGGPSEPNHCALSSRRLLGGGAQSALQLETTLPVPPREGPARFLWPSNACVFVFRRAGVCAADGTAETAAEGCNAVICLEAMD
mmetsp:Transcript_83029/g.230594  ORF Transcript_83029/g.230594 Transcript_83029/m.230594 type:complete len:276 (-) Transcript_83029:118-945(-)